MTPLPRLGGFKILKDVVRFSAVFPWETGLSAGGLLRGIAREKINLPYLNYLQDGQGWGISMVVESPDAERTSRLVEKWYAGLPVQAIPSAVISVFPHRKDPEITGALIEALCKAGVVTDAAANSPSTISVVLRQEYVEFAGDALFQPFSFSTFRTPADWKLARKGKERLFKEVVASYREKHPKVYGLDCENKQAYLRVHLKRDHLCAFCAGLKEFSRMKAPLTFLSMATGREDGHLKFGICLPESTACSYPEVICRAAPCAVVETAVSVSLFAMNGPHFGDRYGIAWGLIHALNSRGVDLLALNCTIASVVGVVPSPLIGSAVEAVKECFDVPAVTERD